MLDTICRHIRNYFISETVSGSFSIVSGALKGAGLISSGSYYLIYGSKYNDGVHTSPDDTLINEDFDGDVAFMSPPAEFLKLCSEIEEYCSSNVGASAFKKESFGGYSYERFSGSDGGTPSWQSVFAAQLNPWRKI